jgi:hypothetical protein
MANRFFDKIVDVVDNTVDGYDAHELVKRHCKLIGKKPDDLKPEHAGLFIMKLMSSLSDRLPRNQWGDLDKKFKKLINEHESAKGKVKGVLLSGTMDYVALKQGKLALNEIIKRIKLPTTFREESWYPIDILEEFLDGVDLVMLQKGGLRSRSVGRYVISNRVLRNRELLFGPKQASTYDAFKNISEVLSLQDFSLKKEEGMLLLSFEGDINRHFREFIMGICDGIFKIRNVFPSSVELVDSDSGGKIVLRFDVMEKGVVS